MTIQYQYIVTYKYIGGDGRIIITRFKPIKTEEDIIGIDEHIRQYHRDRTSFHEHEDKIPNHYIDSIYATNYKLLNRKLVWRNK